MDWARSLTKEEASYLILLNVPFDLFFIQIIAKKRKPANVPKDVNEWKFFDLVGENNNCELFKLLPIYDHEAKEDTSRNE